MARPEQETTAFLRDLTTNFAERTGLDEGASTRLLVHSAKLIVAGVDPVTACRSAIAQPLTDDAEMLSAVNELSASLF